MVIRPERVNSERQIEYNPWGERAAQVHGHGYGNANIPKPSNKKAKNLGH